jgi:hypothetical protein
MNHTIKTADELRDASHEFARLIQKSLEQMAPIWKERGYRDADVLKVSTSALGSMIGMMCGTTGVEDEAHVPGLMDALKPLAISSYEKTMLVLSLTCEEELDEETTAH